VLALLPPDLLEQPIGVPSVEHVDALDVMAPLLLGHRQIRPLQRGDPLGEVLAVAARRLAFERGACEGRTADATAAAAEATAAAAAAHDGAAAAHDGHRIGARYGAP
jgi:hypothetical protein